MNVKMLLKPNKAKLLVLFLVIIPLALIFFGILVIVGMSTLMPLSVVSFGSLFMLILFMLFMLFYWPLGAYFYLWQRLMDFLTFSQSHSIFVWQELGPYIFGFVVILNIFWQYFLACLVEYWRQKRKKSKVLS